MPRNQSEKGPRLLEEKTFLPAQWTLPTQAYLFELPDNKFAVSTRWVSDSAMSSAWRTNLFDSRKAAQAFFGELVEELWWSDIRPEGTTGNHPLAGTGFTYAPQSK